MEPYKPLETGHGTRLCVYVCVYARPRLHYRLLTLCPAPTDPVPRGLLTLWARAGMRARVRSAMPFAYLFVRARERTHTHTHTRKAGKRV